MGLVPVNPGFRSINRPRNVPRALKTASHAIRFPPALCVDTVCNSIQIKVDANALTTSTLTNHLTSGHAALAQGTSMLKMIFALDATISVQHAVDLEPARLVSLMQHLPLEFALVHQGSIWRMAHALSAWMAVRAVRKGQLVPCVKMASYLRKISA